MMFLGSPSPQYSRFIPRVPSGPPFASPQKLQEPSMPMREQYASTYPARTSCASSWLEHPKCDRNPSLCIQ